MHGNCFDKKVIPVVTAGAYSAGDIMGGLLEFNIAGGQPGCFVWLKEIAIALKSAVAPSFTAVLFKQNPSATTQTDNAAYSLNVADFGKVACALPFNMLGAYVVDHGTPNTIVLPDINRFFQLAPGETKLYGLLIDNSGVTLGSVSDLEVSARGLIP